MARRPDNPRPGLVVIDKPQGLTSHDVVARVRRLAHTRKVGHGGTLDPMATGVLVIGIGKATKLFTWVSGHSKEYRATIRFGVATNTDDAEGFATAAVGCASLSDEELESALTPLRGDIMQVPSTVSAIKVNGKRAYALARAGQDVELAARPVHISRLEVLAPPRPVECVLDEDDAEGAPDAELPSGPVNVVDVDVVVECSSGTYVRALARDAGEALGVGAHLTALRRTRVGDVTLESAMTLEELSAAVEAATPEGEPDAEPVLPLVPLGEAARTMFPTLLLTQAEAGAFAHGQAPRRSPSALAQWAAQSADRVHTDNTEGISPIAALSPDGTVLGLLRLEETRLRTVLVF